MFWTVNDEYFGQGTLCEACALFEINLAARESERFDAPFGSMTEALVTVNALCAAHDIEPLNIEGSQAGRCDKCGHAEGIVSGSVA